MDTINNRSIDVASPQQAKLKLINFKLCTRKFDTSEFGVCIKCKQENPIKGILIRHESLFSVNCL